MSTKKNTAANKTAKTTTVAPATTGANETVQVTGKVVGPNAEDALKEQKLNETDNATALRLQEINAEANKGAEINTDKKTSDADLPQKRGSVTKESSKVDADEVGSSENKTTHEISGKLVYETAADYQASLKKDK